MPVHYRTLVTAVGPEVADLAEGGVLILFAEGAPPELAEVSVLHRVAEGPTADAPPIGATITFGDLTATLTAIGALAWAKIADLGHVVVTFDGATTAGRPGELNATPVPDGTLADALKPGVTITIAA